MLDKLFSLFKGGAIKKISCVTTFVSNMIDVFDKEFEQDKDAKNAAIDTVIELLQKHKTP